MFLIWALVVHRSPIYFWCTQCLHGALLPGVALPPHPIHQCSLSSLLPLPHTLYLSQSLIHFWCTQCSHGALLPGVALPPHPTHQCSLPSLLPLPHTLHLSQSWIGTIGLVVFGVTISGLSNSWLTMPEALSVNRDDGCLLIRAMMIGICKTCPRIALTYPYACFSVSFSVFPAKFLFLLWRIFWFLVFTASFEHALHLVWVIFNTKWMDSIKSNQIN